MALPRTSYNVGIPHVRFATSLHQGASAAAVWVRFTILLIGLLFAGPLGAMAGETRTVWTSLQTRSLAERCIQNDESASTKCHSDHGRSRLHSICACLFD